ncbi:MAG: hypothetical protein HZA90_16955, partial [Verrucomicrobia bacterium]|nr:hypothetical protein [Verrucomicrobiota bacterium]
MNMLKSVVGLVIGLVTLFFTLCCAVSVHARPRPPVPPLPPLPGTPPLLFQASFDEAFTYGQNEAVVSIPHFGNLVQSWSGLALERAGVWVPPFVVRGIDAGGHTNLACDGFGGAVRLWLTPYWSSSGAGGAGIGNAARVLDFAAVGGGDAVTVWSLQVTPDGNAFVLLTPGEGGPVEVLRAPIAWRAGEAHLVVLDYGPQGTGLFLDGRLVATGAGTLGLPAPAAALMLGSTLAGTETAGGAFDEVGSFGGPLSEAQVAAYFQQTYRQAALGPISEDEDAARLAARQARVAQSLWAAGGQTMLLDFGEGGCSEFKLTASLLPALHVFTNQGAVFTNHNVKLTWCGREPGVVYDLLYATNIAPPIRWEWWREIQTNDVELTITNFNPPAMFFRLARVLDLETLPAPSLYVSASAATGGDGSKDLPYQNLGSALAAATNESVIRVLPGVYTGPSNRNLSFGAKRLVLVAERGAEQTVIDCTNAAGSRAFIFNSVTQAWWTVVAGFTISNAASGAVWCSDLASPTFANCHFARNASADSGGAVFCTNASPVFVNCRFMTNRATRAGGAVYVTGSNAL